MIKLYTDGSFRDGRVGYAFVIVNDNTSRKDYGKGETVAYTESRNITGEVMAVIAGLHECSKMRYNNIDIYHDYVGIEKWFTGEWEAKSEIAKVYVREMGLIVPYVFPIHFHHIKAHSGDYWNEYVDRMAKEAIGL